MSGNIGTGLIVLGFAAAMAFMARQRLNADKLNAKLSGESATWPTAPGEITSVRIDVHVPSITTATPTPTPKA